MCDNQETLKLSKVKLTPDEPRESFLTRPELCPGIKHGKHSREGFGAGRGGGGLGAPPSGAAGQRSHSPLPLLTGRDR